MTAQILLDDDDEGQAPPRMPESFMRVLSADVASQPLLDQVEVHISLRGGSRPGFLNMLQCELPSGMFVADIRTTRRQGTFFHVGELSACLPAGRLFIVGMSHSGQAQSSYAQYLRLEFRGQIELRRWLARRGKIPRLLAELDGRGENWLPLSDGLRLQPTFVDRLFNVQLSLLCRSVWHAVRYVLTIMKPVIAGQREHRDCGDMHALERAFLAVRFARVEFATDLSVPVRWQARCLSGAAHRMSSQVQEWSHFESDGIKASLARGRALKAYTKTTRLCRIELEFRGDGIVSGMDRQPGMTTDFLDWYRGLRALHRSCRSFYSAAREIHWPIKSCLRRLLKNLRFHAMLTTLELLYGHELQPALAHPRAPSGDLEGISRKLQEPAKKILQQILARRAFRLRDFRGPRRPIRYILHGLEQHGYARRYQRGLWVIDAKGIDAVRRSLRTA